ncbi:MAG: diphthine--ammonia ligase [Candidatus Omnitrophica bacterium]|nr:diphthine--ammonia ligase [Candidatus Omnitrophota bacterium]
MNNVSAIASWSGGKDSCLACYRAIKQGYKIKLLLNFISRESKRGCFHGLEGALLKFQAERIGIPLVQKEVSPDMKKYEEEFKAAVNELKGSDKDISAMVFGDIYLLEHQSWVERVCNELRVTAVEPLWNLDPEEIIRDFIASGFKAIIVSCKADVMGREFIGRQIDMELVKELKKIGVCPCGEKGEFHTLVVDGPIFDRPIEILESEVVIKESFWTHWFLDIKKIAGDDRF